MVGIRNSQNIIDERLRRSAQGTLHDTFGSNGEHSLSAVAGLEVFEERHLNEWFDAYGVNYNLGYLTTYSPLLFTNLRNKGKQYYEIRPTLDRGVSLVGNVDYTLLGRYRVNASYAVKGRTSSVVLVPSAISPLGTSVVTGRSIRKPSSPSSSPSLRSR